MEQIFSKEDFSILKYNIIHVAGDVLKSKEGSGLSHIRSFVGCTREDKDRLIKYIILMYSKESPFVTQFKDVAQRKRESALMAGYNLEKDESLLDLLFRFEVRMEEEPDDWDEKEDGVFQPTESEDDIQFISMTVDYLKYQNDLIWSMIVSNEQTFYEYQEALLQPVDNFRGDKDRLTAISVKTKLMEDSDAIEARLEKYYKKVFPDSEVQKKSRTVYTPERMAKMKNV